MTFDHIEYMRDLLEKLNYSKLPVVSYSKRPLGKSIIQNKRIKNDNKIIGIEIKEITINDNSQGIYQ